MTGPGEDPPIQSHHGAMPTLVLGVDPGVTGALVLLDPAVPRLVAVLDMPTVIIGGKKWVDGAAVLDWLDGWSIENILVEQPGSRGSGDTGGKIVRNMGNEATLAAGVGGVVSVLLCLGRPLDLVRPQVWKKRAGLIGQDKKASLGLARARLGSPPELRREKDVGRAEAVLIGLYGARMTMMAAAA